MAPSALGAPSAPKVAPRRHVRFLAAAVALIAAGMGGVAHASFTYSVGPAETIYTKAQRQSLGLPHWPDGSLGVVPRSDGQYDFYAANSTSPVKTTGSLDNPGQSKRSISIANLRDSFNYVSGGPVYFDAMTGSRLMIYHAEKHATSDRDYYSMLGMAVSTDPAGLQFQDLGVIVQSNVPMAQRPHSIDVGGGSFAVLNGQLHVYFRDYPLSGPSSELAVARAPLADVLNNARTLQATSFTKYYNGGWTEPALGGRSSSLEIGNPANTWSSVAYNEHLNGLVMVSSQWEASGAGGDLYMTTSADGVNWTSRQPIALDPGEQMYPSLVGNGADPQRTGRSFYAYYTDSAAGVWNRWNDAKLVRRLITLDPAPPADPPPNGSHGWTEVAGFQGDFQAGGPAPGWTYAWNPTGKLNNPAQFAPLQWSDAASAYNTTGAATQAYNGKSHTDDYLSLNAAWGHPGQPNYYAIAGYTIQPSDGDGLYRIAGGALRKADSIPSKGEDGLDLWVYLNNLPVGQLQQASTNGTAIAFDRDLGQLTVGSTVYVMIGAGKNQSYDAFTGFDFRIERSTQIQPPPPPPPVWTTIADYRDDLRAGGPAPGWKYAWSSTGKLGDAASFTSLVWSEVAGAYNTTGGTTTVWNGVSHPDDYLSLYLDGGGHPGLSKYAAIAGYTIQGDDGAGLFRLVASSIKKGDAVASPGEDGLEVSIYVNNRLIGAPQAVSTSGALVAFDRDLGALSVGDAVYVIVAAGKNNSYDYFTALDFTIEKLAPAGALVAASGISVAAVPEPRMAATAALCCAAGALGRRSTRRRTT